MDMFLWAKPSTRSRQLIEAHAACGEQVFTWGCWKWLGWAVLTERLGRRTATPTPSEGDR